jgi:hypothetical protein
MGGTIPIRNCRAGDRVFCGGEPIRKLSLIAYAKLPQQVCLVYGKARQMRDREAKDQHERYPPG